MQCLDSSWASFGSISERLDVTSASGYALVGQRKRSHQQYDLENIQQTNKIPTDFANGDRVFHQKFGMGNIRSIDGDKLEIAFDKAGHKKVIAGFVSKP